MALRRRVDLDDPDPHAVDADRVAVDDDRRRLRQYNSASASA